MQKKILIISRAFYPQNSPRSMRATELAKEFSNKGHNVVVYTIKNDAHHLKFEEEFGLEINDIGNLHGKISETKPKNKLSFLKRLTNRVLDYFFHYPNIEWMFKTYNLLKKQTTYYDLMLTIAVPHPIHWGAALARKKNNKIAKVWLADCGDPFMLDQSDSFRKIFYFKYFEKLWNKRCDFIIVPFEGAKNGYYKEFRDKIKIIPQGFSFPPIKDTLETNKIPTFVYSGNIGSYRHYYEPFFKMLNDIDIDFKFLIFTKEEEIYKKGLENIKEKIIINKYIPREELLNVLNTTDFLIHFPYLNKQQKSLKLIDYNYVEKPILSYCGSSDDIVFREFLLGNFENRMEQESIEKFKIENVTSQFLNLIQG